MVTRFGSREICDVTFKALTAMNVGNTTFKAGQPVFIIDTATASSMEQATTTVYAQGGRGYNRLVTWEGEKTVTFNVTDALMSPLGLAMLTGAGLSEATEDNVKHIHVTMDATTDATGAAKVTLAELVDELGLPGTTESVNICDDSSVVPYATILDHNGAIIGWANTVSVTTSKATADSPAEFSVKNTIGDTETVVKDAKIKLDFYVYLTDNLTQITIAPDSFGGTFYVEADTLYRNQDGKDMAATLTFPKVKIQSGFTISMAPTGDPSTFDFVMDAMPGYTYFDNKKKVVCDISIVGGATATSDSIAHTKDHKESP